MPTIASVLNEAVQLLAAAQVPETRLTANVLLAYTLERDRAYLFAHPEAELEPDQAARYLAYIKRRAAGEPLQYITGVQEFYGLDFKVTPAVLIPRPETEFIIEQVLKLAAAPNAQQPRGGQALIIDVGTGSGCLAVTLAVKLRWARVIALDISPAALAIAQVNALRHGVDTRIEFVPSDLFSGLKGSDPRPQADFIVSNPPYIPAGDRAGLQREVRDYEPPEALFATEEGLAFYRRLLAEAGDWLHPEGSLICEIGSKQLPQIELLAHARDWQLAEITPDLQGIPRTLTLKRRAAGKKAGEQGRMGE